MAKFVITDNIKICGRPINYEDFNFFNTKNSLENTNIKEFEIDNFKMFEQSMLKFFSYEEFSNKKCLSVWTTVMYCYFFIYLYTLHKFFIFNQKITIILLVKPVKIVIACCKSIFGIKKIDINIVNLIIEYLIPAEQIEHLHNQLVRNRINICRLYNIVISKFRNVEKYDIKEKFNEHYL